MRVGLLWESKSRGLYSMADFATLYRQIGHNNGNLAFVHAVENQLDAEIKYFPWHVSHNEVNALVDAVVIPSANQLGKHTDLGGLARNLERFDVPVIAIGLGAQSTTFDRDVELSEGTARWLDVLVANGKRFGIQNIWTRGPYTTAQIEKLTGAATIAGGCPSHFINPRPDLGRRLEAKWNDIELPRAIAVAGGHQAWANVRTIEQQLIGLMMDALYPGIYVPQSMGDMIKITRGLFDEIDPPILDRIRQHTVPHYTLEEFKLWANRYAKTYYDVAAWMDDLRRHDLVIGPRYHGTALAVQSEIMGCTVTIDTRTEEMCRQTGVPFVPAANFDQPITRKTLKERYVKFDGAAYDELRADMCGRYIDFLEGAGLKPAAYLHRVARRDQGTQRKAAG